MTPLQTLRGQMQFFIDFRRRHFAKEVREMRFACIEDLVLKHGRVFPRSLKPPPIEPIAKACFQQSYRLAVSRSRSRWIYCEGYAVAPHGLAVHHAWVTRRDDPTEAYDLAWEMGTRDDTAYMGVAFDPAWVRQMHHASGRQQFSALDTWWAGYPLITGRTRIEDVMWGA